MKWSHLFQYAMVMLAASMPLFGADDTAQAKIKKPNILVIMGDDMGWFNIGAYHRGIMSGKTPNLDKLASEGMLFTDYYAEASCTAGRANFITGELPIRTGLTTVGQAGADVGLPDQGMHNRHRTQSTGLHHWPVRQKPPRRLEQIPADSAWLRRISLATYIISMRCRIPIGSIILKTGLTKPARAIWSIPGRPTLMIRLNNHAGVRSANRRSWTKAHWRHFPT